MRNMFINTNETLFLSHETKTGKEYACETEVSKEYATPLDVFADHDADTIARALRLDFQTDTMEPVTEELADAWLRKYRPEAHEKVPPFVAHSIAWDDYKADLRSSRPFTKQEHGTHHIGVGL